MLIGKTNHSLKTYFYLPQAGEASSVSIRKPENVSSESSAQSPGPSTLAKQLLGRKESSTSRSVSPKILSDSASSLATNITAPAVSQPVQKHSFMTERSIKLIDEQQFSDTFSEYLSDNQDFFVVGVLGSQSTGKSTLMNALAKGLIEQKSSNDENNSTTNGVGHKSNFFRVQSFEKQMTGEHCTNGISVWISPKHRIILIDSQPINSPSVLDRTIQVNEQLRLFTAVFFNLGSAFFYRKYHNCYCY